MGKTGLVYHPAYLEHDMGMGILNRRTGCGSL